MRFPQLVTKEKARTWLRRLLLVLAAVAIGGGLKPGLPEGRWTGSDYEDRVRDFVQAFNARDVEAMLTLVDENIQWVSVDGAGVTIETKGRQALEENMKRYFTSCPTCNSALTWIQSSGSRVAATERATWVSKSGANAKSSLSVYEFNDGKIRRVYYFPSEAVLPQK